MKKAIVTIAFTFFIALVNAQQIPKWKITDIEKLMQASDSNVLVINFWATFCKPCVAEIPSFIKTVEKYKKESVKLILVSVDLASEYPKKIAAFAKKHHFNTNISWLNETNADYFCPKIDADWSGAIPATLILNKKTGYRFFIEGEISEAVFEETIKKAIGK